jgi:glycosyltransferase involved in cell wall biosynthesis
VHIAVFFQHYHTPDCPTAARPYALVQELAAHHHVTLVATDAGHRQRITYDFDWVPPGVDAHWLHVPYANAMSSAERFRSYMQYGARALWQSRRLGRPDVVFGSSTPLTVGLVAAGAARYWRVPWIFEVRDLWPDFPIQMGAIPFRPVQRFLYWIERWLYRDAAHVITASPGQADHVRRFVSSSKPVSIVEYGTELDVLDAITPDELDALRAQHSLPERFIVLYAGSFGRANAIPALIETADRCANRDDVCFVITGRGYHEPALQRAARRNPVLRVLPPQPRRRALALFQLADLALVPFIDQPVLATNAPSKLFDSLAAGTPVVVTNPGWTQSLVRRHDCGWSVPEAQADLLAERIATLLDRPDRLQQAGQNGTKLARKRFDRSVHMRRLRTLIESVGVAAIPSG